MDPLTIILAITTTTATIAAIHQAGRVLKLKQSAYAEAEYARGRYNFMGVAANRDAVKYERRIADLERQAIIRSEQLARAQKRISDLVADRAILSAILTKHEARRLADNAARKARHERAKGAA